MKFDVKIICTISNVKKNCGNFSCLRLIALCSILDEIVFKSMYNV